jgi:hypothetical protein
MNGLLKLAAQANQENLEPEEFSWKTLGKNTLALLGGYLTGYAGSRLLSPPAGYLTRVNRWGVVGGLSGGLLAGSVIGNPLLAALASALLPAAGYYGVARFLLKHPPAHALADAALVGGIGLGAGYLGRKARETAEQGKYPNKLHYLPLFVMSMTDPTRANLPLKAGMS